MIECYRYLSVKFQEQLTGTVKQAVPTKVRQLHGEITYNRKRC